MKKGNFEAGATRDLRKLETFREPCREGRSRNTKAVPKVFESDEWSRWC